MPHIMAQNAAAEAKLQDHAAPFHSSELTPVRVNESQPYPDNTAQHASSYESGQIPGAKWSFKHNALALSKAEMASDNGDRRAALRRTRSDRRI
jgi:hypothetical protein